MKRIKQKQNNEIRIIEVLELQNSITNEFLLIFNQAKLKKISKNKNRPK